MDPKISLMVVDDSKFMRAFVRRSIEESELRDRITVVGEAGSGVEAIEKFNSLRPNMIIMDIVMPLGSGVDVLKKIREVDKDVVVLLATALDQAAMRKEASELGTAGFIVKPFKPDDLLSAVKIAIKTVKVTKAKVQVPPTPEPVMPKVMKSIFPEKKLAALSGHIQSLAKKVAISMSQMGADTAKAFVISWNVTTVEDMLKTLGGAKMVVYGAICKMHGSGDPVLVSALPESYSDMIVKTLRPSEMSRDSFWQTLKEAFNILQTGLILTLSDDIGIKLTPGSPILSVDTLSNVADFVKNTVSPEVKYSVFINIRIVIKGEATSMLGILFLSEKSLKALSKNLKAA